MFTRGYFVTKEKEGGYDDAIRNYKRQNDSSSKSFIGNSLIKIQDTRAHLAIERIIITNITIGRFYKKLMVKFYENFNQHPKVKALNGRLHNETRTILT